MIITMSEMLRWHDGTLSVSGAFMLLLIFLIFVIGK